MQVHAPNLQHPDWRHSAIWSGVYRAILHPDVDVAAPVLLPVRLPVPRVCDSCHHMRGDHNRALLLSAMQ